MKKILLLVLFAVLQCSTAIELTNDGLNVLSRENLDYTLSQNYTVLALWNSQNCISCAKTMWEVYKAIYSFLHERTFFVLAGNVGTDESMDLQYEIDNNEGGTQYRLFLSQSTVPIARREDDSLNDDLITWLSKETHFAPQEDHVIELTPQTFDAFLAKNSFRSVMVHFYLPHYQPSQRALVQFQRAALAFKIEAKAVFARLDCTGHAEFCTEKGVQEMPAFIFFPKKDLPFDGKQIVSKRGEGIVYYLNDILNTQVDPRGGFNEQFGREYELDRLARLFIANNNENQHKRIIKDTAKLRHRYHSTAKYYRVMKNFMKEGPTAIMRELSAIRKEYEGVKVEDPVYAKLRARENIIHQFEMLDTSEHVRLNPWSFDYVVNGLDDVVVMFYTSWCKECAELLKEFDKNVKEVKSEVIVASIDAQTYVDYCANFRISHFPTVLYFKANTSVKEYKEISVTSWKDIQTIMDDVAGEKEL